MVYITVFINPKGEISMLYFKLIFVNIEINNEIESNTHDTKILKVCLGTIYLSSTLSEECRQGNFQRHLEYYLIPTFIYRENFGNLLRHFA